MNRINRMMTNICSENLLTSKEFYIALFDFEVSYDSDWFVHLVSKSKQLELGIIDKTSKMIPKGFQNLPKGFYITLVVDHVDDIYEIAKTKNVEIVSVPENTSYGQRRLLLKDPNGALIDISSPIEDFKF